jgi:hypothetical protein
MGSKVYSVYYVSVKEGDVLLQMEIGASCSPYDQLC